MIGNKINHGCYSFCFYFPSHKRSMKFASAVLIQSACIYILGSLKRIVKST